MEVAAAWASSTEAETKVELAQITGARAGVQLSRPLRTARVSGWRGAGSGAGAVGSDGVVTAPPGR
jgi:hypothetical protein